MITPTSSNDFEQLAADWQATDAPGPAPEAIRRYVRARTRVLKIWTAGEVAIGLVALPVLARLAWTMDDPAERVAMISLALVTVAALAGSWWNWAGMVHLRVQSTAMYVALSLERLERMRRACRMGWGLLVLEVAVFAWWVPHRLADRGGSVRGWALLVGMTAAAVLSLWWVRTWIARDERRLGELRRDLEG